jgi:NADPH2:quinone reductase
VGIAAIQMARVFGARVLTTVGSPAKADAVRALGAHVVVDRHETDLGGVLDRCAKEGRAVDVVLDCVGGPDLGPHLAKLAAGGRWVLIATLAGTRTDLDLRPILLRGLRLIGSTLRGRPLETKARILRELAERVWPEIDAGRIRPVVHQVLPIERAEEAHAILERRENVGKVVLQIA